MQRQIDELAAAYEKRRADFLDRVRRRIFVDVGREHGPSDVVNSALRAVMVSIRRDRVRAESPDELIALVWRAIEFKLAERIERRLTVTRREVSVDLEDDGAVTRVGREQIVRTYGASRTFRETEAHRIARLFSRLDALRRSILIADLEGHTRAEIARRLHLTEDAVKHGKASALVVLRLALEMCKNPACGRRVLRPDSMRCPCGATWTREEARQAVGLGG